VAGPHRAVVTLLATANGGLIELGVPDLRHGPRHVRLRLSRAAARTGAGRSAAQGRRAPDPAAARSLKALLPTFFRAYASGDPAWLGVFTAGRRSVAGLGVGMRFSGRRARQANSA
jgi:hypothetical protein